MVTPPTIVKAQLHNTIQKYNAAEHGKVQLEIPIEVESEKCLL